MHELAMAEGMLQVVLEAAGSRTVRSIRLTVGQLHAVVPDSLRFSFELLAEGTAAAGAVLDLNDVPVSIRCKQCGVISTCPTPPFQCGTCQTSDVVLASGTELAVEEVRLEDGSIVAPCNTLPQTLAAHLSDEHGF